MISRVIATSKAAQVAADVAGDLFLRQAAIEQPAVVGNCDKCDRVTKLADYDGSLLCMRCGAAAADPEEAPDVDRDRVRLHRVVGLLARWRETLSQHLVGTKSMHVEHAQRLQTCIDELAAELNQMMY